MPETLTACPVCLRKIDPKQPVFESDNKEVSYQFCSCGAAFLNPRATDEESYLYYSSGAYRNQIERIDTDLTESIKQHQRRAEYIARFVSGPIKSHLDIGCSDGALLREIRIKHPDIISAGVDMDPIMATTDFDVHPTIDEVEGTFDLITLIHTLEHINQPRRMITAIYDRLSPGGNVMIEVPNRRAEMGAFQPPQHVVAYDEKSLTGLLIGFKNIHTFFHGMLVFSPLDLNIFLTAMK